MNKQDLYDLGLRISKTNDGNYKMTVSKEYISR